MKRAQRVAAANLADEATECIRNALRTDMTIHSTVIPDRLQLAAEIHHGIGHYLANAIMRLQLCQQHLVGNPTRAEELLRTSLTCAQVAMDAVRTTIRSLGSANAQTPQFTEILHLAVDRLKIMTTAQFHLDIDLVRPLPPAMVPGIAAVACEALTNAVKHADAQNIFLKLVCSDEHVMLRVIDDGKGFEEERQLLPNDRWSGFGLSLMRDQVHYLGGTFRIQSIPAQGTQVMVKINNRQEALSFQKRTNALM
jgi:signal transduction histidine kinase